MAVTYAIINQDDMNPRYYGRVRAAFDDFNEAMNTWREDNEAVVRVKGKVSPGELVTWDEAYHPEPYYDAQGHKFWVPVPRTRRRG